MFKKFLWISQQNLNFQVLNSLNRSWAAFLLIKLFEFIPASPTVKILGDKDKLKQVFINIVRNACEAIAPGDIVKWKVDWHIDKVYININNGGEPIPSQVITKLSQPFFSTKPCGTGLGLAITKHIVNAHSGKLLISSDLLTGTTVSVQLSVVL